MGFLKTTKVEQKATNKGDKVEVETTKTQSSLVSTLKSNDKAPKKKGIKDNPLMIIGIIVATLFIIGMIIMALMVSSNNSKKEKEKQAALEKSAQMASAAASTPPATVQAATPNPTVVVDPNDFTVAPDPIQALATQSVTAAIPNTPQYKLGNGVTFTFPDGRSLAFTDPLVTTAKSNATQSVANYLTQNSILQKRSMNGVGDSNGQEAWYIRMPKDPANPNAPEFLPITDIKASQLLREGMAGQAATFMTQELDNAMKSKPTDQPVASQVQAVVPVKDESVITLAEKQGYMDLIAKQRTENLDLIRQNKELKQKMQEQKSQITSVLQKIEDNRYASNKLQASSIPASTGYKVVSVMGDRVWLEDKQGELTSVAVGETLPNTRLKLDHDVNGVIVVTPVK